MRYDESLALKLLTSGGLPTVRIFRWQPWAISLGHHQNIDDIDVPKCAQDGIDVVRRPTGGRAILHAEELTYSVVMRTGRRSVLDVYNEISKGLLHGLQLFGAEAELQKSQPTTGQAYRQRSSIPCFSSSARYEIEWRGRKLVGSAQHRYTTGDQHVVLQHGSILCGPGHLRLSEYIKMSPELRDNTRRDLEKNTVCLQEVTGRHVDINMLGERVRKGFEVAWETSFISDEEVLEPGATNV